MKIAAWVWFIGAAALSISLVVVFSRIDRRMYDSHAPYLDLQEYRENRLAATGLKSERVDARVSFGEMARVTQEQNVKEDKGK